MTGVFAAIGALAVVSAITWAWTKSKQEPKDKK